MNLDIDDISQFLTVGLGLAENSVRVVLGRFGVFHSWLAGRPITKKVAEEFIYSLKSKGLKNNSINSYIFTFRQIFLYFQDREIEVEDFRLKSLPKNIPHIEVLSVAEVKAILKVNLGYGKFRGMDCSRMNVVYKLLIEFLAVTGCRFSEAATLTIDKFDFLTGVATFTDTKNRGWRRAYLTKGLSDKLRAIAGKEFVFSNMLGKAVRPQEFSPDLKKRARLAGVTKRVHPHIFRHSFATHLLSIGVDISLVAKLLGHKDIQTTYKNYAHLADRALKDAAFQHDLTLESLPIDQVLKSDIKIVEGLKSLRDKKRFLTVVEKRDDGFSVRVKVRPKILYSPEDYI